MSLLTQVFFTYLASTNQLPGFSVSGALTAMGYEESLGILNWTQLFVAAFLLLIILFLTLAFVCRYLTSYALYVTLWDASNWLKKLCLKNEKCLNMRSLYIRIFIFFVLIYKHTSYIACLYIIGQIQQDYDLKKSICF